MERKIAMKKLIINNEFIKTIDKEMGLEDTFCWEGSARLTIQSSETPLNHDAATEVLLTVAGTSTVEHEGDVDGIETQVHDLKNNEAVIDYFFSKYHVRVFNTECKITCDKRAGDEDYEVSIRGKIFLKIMKL